MEALMFFMIFGMALLLAAGFLSASKDPRESILLAREYTLQKMTKKGARVQARRIAGIVAAIGLVIILVCGMGILWLNL